MTLELHYSPLACSLAARVACLEGGLEVAFRRTDLATKRVDGEAEGALLRRNPMGKVPTLVGEGFVLTENVAVLLYLADRAGLAPSEGTAARYELVRWLAFIATEVHKRVLATVFSLERPGEPVKAFARDGAAQALGVLDQRLRDRAFLVGDSFSVADAYLVWALFLLPRPPCSAPLDAFPAVRAYAERHLARESVKRALAIELREYKEPGWWTAQQL